MSGIGGGGGGVGGGGGHIAPAPRLAEVVESCGWFLSWESVRSLACSSRGGRAAAAAAVRSLPVQISVVLPVFNALDVGLPIALRDILRQEDCPPYEVLVTDDGSTDGSREWLVALAKSLGVRGCVCLDESSTGGGAASSAVGDEAVAHTSSADGAAAIAVAMDDEHHLGGRSGATSGTHASLRGETAFSGGGGFPLSAVAAAASRPFVRLVILTTIPGARGQGAAMDRGLDAGRGELLALMESDDTRPRDTLAQLFGRFDGLADGSAVEEGAGGAWGEVSRRRGSSQPPASSSSLGDPQLPDAVCSAVHLVAPMPTAAQLDAGPGAQSVALLPNASGLAAFAGMLRYIKWQNGLATNEQMARARFVEIPALHQTSLYRRSDCLSLGGYNANPQWPVDMDFWMRWFGAGKSCVKVCGAGRTGSCLPPDSPSFVAPCPPQPPQPSSDGVPSSYPSLYGWRQHDGQGTRNSGRCSLDNLRRCKVHYLALDPAGPCHGRHVLVISMGSTLAAYTEDLERCGACLSVAGVAWDTKRSAGQDLATHVQPRRAPSAPYSAGAAAAEAPADSAGSLAPPRACDEALVRRVRLFVYGAEKARRRVRSTLGRDWDDDHDWFAA